MQDEEQCTGAIREQAPALRQVTVMFADLTGFTQLSSELDPEDLHRLLSDFFAMTDRIIEQFGGTVENHVGDGVMAVFGAPVARSDDPERAVRAAMAIHAAMAEVGGERGPSLSAHIGIASGQVLVAGDGRQHSVTGQSVNLASRLSDIADPGETLVSEAVRTALADLLQAEEIGGVDVKGMPQAVNVWRARSLAERTVDTRERPFVGRRIELQRLQDILDACRTDGRGAAVYIRGEAGIGKTRLVEEVRRRAVELGFGCYTALILDFGAGRGEDAVRSLARALVDDVAEPGGEDPAEAAIAAGLVQPDRRMFLNELLARPQPAALRPRFEAMDTQARRRGLRETLAELVISIASHRRLLIAIEDVHWARPALLETLQRLVAAAAESPTVLLLTGRIEGDPLDRAWRAATGVSLLTLDLQALSDEEARQLADLYPETGAAFAQRCVQRAGGNPLFLDQLLRSAEVADDEVPGSVQSVVLARMDQLDPMDRLALQAASVMGQRFPLAALRHLVEDQSYGCDGLVREALVRPEGDTFLFAHALVRDAVYASLLRSRRRTLHRHVADWFGDQEPVLHAEHLDRAEDPAAATAYLAAARSEAAAHRHEAALRLAERGAAIAGERPLAFDLICLRGNLLRETGSVEASLAAFRAARDLAEDDSQQAQVALGLAEGMRIVDRYDEALEVLDRAERSIGDDAGQRAQVHYLRGNICFPLGQIDRCLAEHEKALDAAHRAGSVELEARSLGGLGDAEYARGRIRTAHQHFSRCVELCREHGFGRVEVVHLPMIGNNLGFLNDPRGAREAACVAIEAARNVEHLRAELIARHVVFAAFRELDEVTKSRPHIERAQIIAERLGARRFESENLAYLAQIEHAEGRRDAALAHLDEALAIAREGGMGYFGPVILGTLALITEDPEAGRRALAEGEAVLEAGAVSHNHLWFHRDAVDASLGAGWWDEAERHAAALEDYTRAEPLPWSDFYIARGRALAAAGRGGLDDATAATLGTLRDQAERAGLRAAIPAIDVALAARC